MKRILVADDSVTIQKVIALTFADEPFEVKSVGTGTEALELVRTWKPDILLADVIMPQMNGYELCRAAKENPETASIPVLLLAGTFEAFDEEEAGSVRADDYITKPFESGELIAKVRTLTGGEVPPEPVAREKEESAPDVKAEVPIPAEKAAPEQVGEESPEELPEEPGFSPEEPPASAPPEEGGEPDIWDILSEVEDLSSKQGAEVGAEEVSSLHPLEEKGVIDVGSFDVGLDRPEPSPPPVEAEPEPLAAPPSPPGGTAEPAAKEAPLSEELAFEDSIDFGPGEEEAPKETVPFPPDSVEGGFEKSQVENREKNFFGFEVENFEAPPADDALGDAVEEITFDLEKSGQAIPEAGPEVSSTEPEPVPQDIPSPPETLLESPPEGPEISFSVEEPESSPEGFAPADEWGGAPQDRASEAFSSPLSEPSPEIPPFQGAMEEGLEDSEPPLELDMKKGYPAQTSPSAALDEAQIRKIVEEKVEKIAWEVVPELAEILIREAIEKIKGGS